MHPFLNIAIQAARTAGRTMLHFYDRLSEIEVTEKAKNDVVTEVDRICEQEIIEHIKKAYPRHSILGEESGLDKKGDEYCWIIDPLDGTANYVNGLPHFCISIAVKKGDQLEIGCIYDPIRQELFTATRGKGAQLNNKRIRISDTKKLENCLVGTGFPFRYPDYIPTYLKMFNSILPQTSDIRRAGAAALDLAYVACGRLDCYWEAFLKPWDIAAGALMVQEAGGVITDFNEEKGFLTKGEVVAGSIITQPALLKLVREQL
jgi:myo-inositol-1(or 4)-monophosphatase